jgi:hypothetical protein
MAMQFSHAVGYRGLASVNNKTLLCTGGNINLTQDPIMSGGVWGAGYANAAPIAYAFNYLSLEGSVNFEWVSGIWSTMKGFAFDDRTSQTPVKLLPDGKNGFEGNGWCSSISFEASEGAALTGSLNFKGDPSGNNIKATGEGDTTKNGAGTPVASNLVGAVLIPYWQTSVYFSNNVTFGAGGATASYGSPLKDIINWSCSYNSDLQVLKCCNYQANAPIAPDYILCGEMSGEGSYTIFKIAGDFNPTSYHKVKGIKFQVGASHTVEIPAVLVSSGSTSMTTGASYVSVDYSFTAIGDGVNSIMKMN